MVKDLREYLELLKEKGWIDVVTQPRDLSSLAAAMKEQEKKERTVLFENIRDYDCPMVNNLFANRDFLAALFECPTSEVTRVFSERYERRIKPVMVEAAPVQTRIYTGDEIDILRFPFIQHAPKDGGRYISAGMVIAKDPKTGKPKYESPVSYWMPFEGNMIGFHDATWQNDKSFDNAESYKWCGSHGCINLRLADAKALHDCIKVGLCVVVHS